MSLRTAARTLTSSTRGLASTSKPLQDIPSGSSFAALQGVFDAPPTLPEASTSRPNPTSSSKFLVNRTSPNEVNDPIGRGYRPHSLPPPVDPTLDLFTNLLMQDGKKSEAQSRVSRILQLVQRVSNQSPLPLLQRAITLASPSIRMLSVRKSIKTVLSPRGLNERQRTRQGIMWILKAAEKGRKGGVHYEERITREIFAVLEGTSEVFKKVEEVHRVATANRSNLASR